MNAEISMTGLGTRFGVPPRLSAFLLMLFALCLHLAKGCAAPLTDQARRQIGVTTSYDPAYKKLSYPGGDVPIQTGVCSDVVVRAFRGLGIDLQKEVHEDMVRAFSRYPQKWGLKGPDSNIDHRRVPNLMTYFSRKGWAVASSSKGTDFLPGDVVSWDLGSGVTHIGIVSDGRAPSGNPLVIHNIGSGVKEENILFQFRVIGHYRPRVSSEPGGAPRAAISQH